MKISIITLNLNNRAGLENTVCSVLSQTFPNLEYIVIDGGSSDGSVEVLNSHSDQISFWSSEKDAGIYAAMNKGVEKVTGEYILFLNSGDTLVDRMVIETMQKQLDGTEMVYGSINVCRDEKMRVVKEYPSSPRFSYMVNGSLPHPATFFRSDLFLERGFRYDESLKICADWKLYMLLLFKTGVSFKRVNLTVANFLLDGVSSSPRNKELLKKEKDGVLKIEFSGLYEDLAEYKALKTTVNNMTTRELLVRVYRKILSRLR